MVALEDDRDQVLLKLHELDRVRHADSHLGKHTKIDNKYWANWKKIKKRGYRYWSENIYHSKEILHKDILSLVVAPAWGIIFPPYNLARLSGLLRHHGYGVQIYDINVHAYTFFKENGHKNFWDSIYYYSWERPAYDDEIKPILTPLLDQYINKIISSNSNIIGFSLYLTNILASMYMITELKRLKPELTIIVGGPESFNDWFQTLVEELGFDPNLIDYRITGEGEQELLNLMENFKDNTSSEMITLGGFKSKLPLNDLPFPDYSDYNLYSYEYPDGASIETSRGCIAQCSFCAETWFWKYRWRASEKVIEEIKYQIEHYGAYRFWFVDSLANGNLKEFKNLVELIIENKLNIRWNSYARNDGRMDLDFFRKIYDSGCLSLSFGVESGSQKVLTDMQKKITIKEIEDNFRDSHTVGLTSHANWVVGFPTEGPAEFLHSLQILHNCRKWIYAISPGYTCGDAPFSDMNIAWKKYDIQWKENPWDNKFMSNWWTSDYKNTIVHRAIRLKLINIWLELLVNKANGTLINTQHRPSLQSMYNVELLDPNWEIPEHIVQQDNQNFAYFSGDNTVEQFSAGLANEYLPMAWVMYQVFGPFKMFIKASLEEDMPEFGTFITTPYWADVTFDINAEGILNFTSEQQFKHYTTRDDSDVAEYEIVRQDMSFDPVIHNVTGPIDYFNGNEYKNIT